jgi:hypothetical protein
MGQVGDEAAPLVDPAAPAKCQQLMEAKMAQALDLLSAAIKQLEKTAAPISCASEVQSEAAAGLKVKWLCSALRALTGSQVGRCRSVHAMKQ